MVECFASGMRLQQLRKLTANAQFAVLLTSAWIRGQRDSMKKRPLCSLCRRGLMILAIPCYTLLCAMGFAVAARGDERPTPGKGAVVYGQLKAFALGFR